MSTERGYFREVIRVTDEFFAEGFGQWSHSKMYRDVIKAWHIHQQQIDWWYVPMGALKVVLHDLRKEFAQFPSDTGSISGRTIRRKSAKDSAWCRSRLQGAEWRGAPLLHHV